MRHRPVLLAVPACVLVLALVSAWLLVRSEQGSAERRGTDQARQDGLVLTDRLETIISQLATTGGLFAASDHVTEPEFRRFAQTLVAERAIDTVAYIERVPASRRAAFERARGLPITDGLGKEARRSPARAVYLPYVFTDSEPDQPRTGLADAGAEPRRRAAMTAAGATGRARVTEPVRTLNDDTLSLIAYSPVYGEPVPPRTRAERLRELRGFAVGIFPVSRLIAPADARRMEVLDAGKHVAGTRGLEDTSRVPIEIAGRRFELAVATGAQPSYSLAGAVAIGGLLLALALASVLLTLIRREAYAQRLVAERLAQKEEAESALAESQRRNRVLAETATDWVALIDDGGRYTYASPSVQTMLGRSPEEVVGLSFSDLMHPDDVPEITRQFLEALYDGGSRSAEVRVRHADGHWVPLDVGLTIILDEETGTVEEIRAASRDVTDRRMLEGELRRLAVEDELTGLPNRRALMERLESELKLARRYRDGALVLLDLDDFKEINDSRGHSTGDLVLERVAAVLGSRLRASDHVARLGGDEFAVILPRIDSDGALTAAEAILAALREDPELKALFGRAVTASAGIAQMGADGPLSGETVLMRADQAMYSAKRAGGGRAAAWDPTIAVRTVAGPHTHA